VQKAQLIHAAGESAQLQAVPPHTRSVCLRAKNEAHLREIAARLWDKGIQFRLVIESDPPYSGQAMAIGVPLAFGFAAQRALGDLPLAD
jgi:hypothetical protein